MGRAVLSRLAPAALLLLLTLGPAAAQDAAAPPPPPAPAAAADNLPKSAAAISQEVEDDKGFLTRFLERNLSDAGRNVRIEGFRGALSSRALFDSITITDKDGAWITLRNGAIQWNRGALLARRVEIAELSAEVIDLPRRPDAGDGSTPRAEARPFALPQLPVSVDIQRISAGRVNIGQPLFGEAASVSVDGAMSLKSGEGAAKLAIARVDGKRGVFAVDAGYSNATTNLRVDLSLDEDANGIFANLVHLEGRPAVNAQIKGEGPIDDFAADIRLATDGQPRVTGTVAIKAEAGPDGAKGRGFRVRLGGDVAALVPQEQRDFFGTQSQLLAEGWRGDSGRLAVPVMLLDTDALNLSGSFATNDQGAPVNAVMMLTMGQDAGATQIPARLPMRGEPTTVNGARLQFSYDAAQSSAWTLKGHVDGLRQKAIAIGAADLDGGGNVILDGGALKGVTGRITFDSSGIAPADRGVAAVIGDVLKGQTAFDWVAGNAASLTDLDVTGADYGLKGNLKVDGLSSGITVSGEVDARYDDLARLSQLTGRSMRGKATGRVTGHYTLLSRGFDGEVTLAGTDLSLGQEQLDRLLAGNVTVNASARRDETGIDLRSLTVKGERLTADAGGTINSTASDLRASLRLANLAEVDPRLSGTMQAEAALIGPTGARRLTLNGQAVDLTTGIAALDGALRGTTQLAVTGKEEAGQVRLDSLSLTNPQMALTGEGNLTPGHMDAAVSLRANDLAAMGQGWGGSLVADGRITEANGARRLTATGKGESLRLGRDGVDGALSGTTTLTLDATQSEGGAQLQVDRFAVENAQLTATVSGPIGPKGTNLKGEAQVKSLAPFGRDWSGSLQLAGSFADDGTGGRVLDVSGTGQDVAAVRPEVAGLLRGTSQLTLRGREEGGTLTLTEARATSAQARIEATGRIGGGKSDLRATARLADLAALGRGWKGALDAEGTLVDAPDGAQQFAVTGTGEGLSLGQSSVDGALTGTTRFTLRGARKDGTITLAQADVVNDQANVSAAGQIGAAGTDLQGKAAIRSLAALGTGWKGSVDLTGSFADDGRGGRRIDVTGTGEGLGHGGAGDAALTGTTQLALKAVQNTDGLTIEQAHLTNDQAQIKASGRVGQAGTDLTGEAQIKSLAPFGPGWGGSANMTGSLRDDGTGARRLQVQGTGRDLAVGQPRLAGLLRGETQLTLAGSERAGVFTIDTATVTSPQGKAEASGTIGGGATDARAHVDLPSLAPIGPGFRGAVSADATLRQQGDGPRAFTLTGAGRDLSLGQTQVDAALAGETRFDIAGQEAGGIVTLDRAVIDNPRLAADVTGRLGGGETDVKGSLRADSLAFLGRGLRGGINATGAVHQEGNALTLTARGEGRGLGAGNAKADALLAGTTSFDVAARRQGDDLTVERLTARNPQLSLTAEGALASGIRLDARLGDLALLAPGFQGPATAKGTVSRDGGRLGLDLALTGPGGTAGTVAGTMAQDLSTADLRIAGSADAKIANPFMRVRSIEGPVRFDLRLNGKPSLQALSGRVSLVDARLSDPKLGMRIEGLRLDADLGGSAITVNGGGRLSDGGAVAVDGRIGLEGARPLAVNLRLDGARLRDPNLYQTSINGTLTVGGTLEAGPVISGRLALGPTEIRIPSTGLGGAKDIPVIKHLGDRPPVRSTRAKAGLTPYPGPESREAGLAGPPATPPAVAARLDVTIDAPNQVFVRGRGVDAEFGGTIRLTGTVRDIVPVGYMQLIRGRVDLLGKRFDLAEGLLELQGSLMPVVRLVAEHVQDSITTRITIEGEANDPTISFTSSPDMPQEEVLAHLLFGRGLDKVSALQAAQLANAVATLAGRGGEGIISQLRRQTGLDDLDLATDDKGQVTVRAGKYITDKVYTDVSVGGDGKTKLNINLDINKALTARGSVGSSGESTLGLYYEKDY